MEDNTHMSVVVSTIFWKILILLKIHIVIDFVSKVFKNTPYWYEISDKIKIYDYDLYEYYKNVTIV